MTQAALSERSGLSARRLKQLVDRGDLPRNADGSYPLAASLRALAAIRRPPGVGTATEAQAAAKQALAAAVLRERLAKAEARELALREARGELVEVAEVQADARATCEVIRSQLLALPPRTAPLAAAVAEGPRKIAEIEALLEREVNAVLEALHGSRFGGAAAP